MDYSLVLSEEELREVSDHYSSEDAFAFDCETMGEHRGDPVRNHVVWLSLACDHRVDVIPMGHPNGDLLRVDYPLLSSGLKRQAEGKMLRKSDFSKDVRKSLPVFTEPPSQLRWSLVSRLLGPVFAGDALKVAHNAKFDINSLSKYVDIHGPFWDTQVADWVVDPGRTGRLSLKDCVERNIGLVMEKGVGEAIERHSFDEVADYSAMDAHLTLRLFRAQEQTVPDDLMGPLSLDMMLVEVLASMERNGVTVDIDRLKILEEDLLGRRDEVLADCYRVAGRRFNINSVGDKQTLLFAPRKEGGQGLKGRVLTDGAKKRGVDPSDAVCSDFSTSTDALSGYKNPLVKSLLEYQRITKLLSTYVRPYLGGESVRTVNGKEKRSWVEPQTVKGRIHTRFVQTSAETGRLASKQPNLQNVPARSEDGKRIRDLFVPSEGMVLVQADFSQIEPRIIADLSQDPTLLSTYLDGGDVYQSIADLMGVDRFVGKTLVLSIAYGVWAGTIAQRIDVGHREAERLMEDFAAKFPRISAHKHYVINQARRRRDHSSETVTGRKRYLPHIVSSDSALRNRAERQAYNHTIQGSAADVMKVALVKVYRSLPGGARMLLTVHDEVVLEAPMGMEDEVADVVRTQMESSGKPWFTVPLVADVNIANSWGECK